MLQEVDSVEVLRWVGCDIPTCVFCLLGLLGFPLDLAQGRQRLEWNMSGR